MSATSTPATPATPARVPFLPTLLAQAGTAVTITERAAVLVGDVLDRLRCLLAASVQCIVTSPPYLDARDYNVAPTAWPAVTYRPRLDLPPVTVEAMTCCLGHEPTLLAYVAHLVVVARELARVLRPDGVLWLNLGAGYSSGTTAPRKPTTTKGPDVTSSWSKRCYGSRVNAGFPAKQLIRAPSAVCDALQADGWYVRNEIAWHKPAPTPSSARDRCTPAHEFLFLLTRAPRYRSHLERIATPVKAGGSRNRQRKHGADRAEPGNHRGSSIPWSGEMAHPRDVWTIDTERFRGDHFATFATELVRRCVLAGSDPGDVVLDPFAGTGTTLAVADHFEREAVGIEAQATYVEELMRERFADVVRRLTAAKAPKRPMRPTRVLPGPRRQTPTPTPIERLAFERAEAPTHA